MSSTTLYSQEELLSLYKQSIQDNKDDLLKVLKKGTLVPFTILGIINDSQKESWSLSNMTQNESRGALIQHILKSDDVSDYIKFSRCVRYISDVGAGRVFSFMQDLINVGLHDPISKGVHKVPTVAEFKPLLCACGQVCIWGGGGGEGSSYFHHLFPQK